MSFNDVDDKDFLTGLLNAMYDELPPPKSKKKNKICNCTKCGYVI